MERQPLTTKTMKVLTNLFRMSLCLLLVCAGFTSCSDEDNDNQEIKLPENALNISDGNLTIDINGESAETGTAVLTPTGNNTASLTLANVVTGFSTVTMDVQLKATGNGSCTFSGNQDITGPVSMFPKVTGRNQPVASIMSVKVDGAISEQGTAQMTITTTLSQSAQKGLAGEWKPYGSCDVNVLTGSISKAPLMLDWTFTSDTIGNQFIGNLITPIVASNFYQALKSISLNTNGTITITYWKDAQFDISNFTTGAYKEPTHDNWETETTENCMWYADDDYIYLVPNLAALLADYHEDKNEDFTSNTSLPQLSTFDISSIVTMLKDKYGIDPTALGTTLEKWNSTGIPLKYTVKDNEVCIYIDKEMADPVIAILITALPSLDKILQAYLQQNPDKVELASTILSILGMQQLSDFENLWNNTKTFTISVNLTK